MSGYDHLLDCCTAIVEAGRGANDTDETIARVVLAEALRTLETVTKEMEEAWLNTPDLADNGKIDASAAAQGDWRAMLRASPIAPP